MVRKKNCSKCGKYLPETKKYFYVDGNTKCGFRSHCKECMKKSYKKWVENNRSKSIEYSKKHRLLNPEKVKFTIKKTRLKKYGLSIEEYDKMIKEQNNKCAICGCEEKGRRKNGRLIKLAIDHDHKTDKVRGLLCVNCNTAIGLTKENLFILIKIIEYLRSF